MPPGNRHRESDQGFALVGLVVAIFLILLVLSVAAPIVAKSLRRDREVEAVHRANQYVRAIQLYYRKFGHYPGSLDQLEKSNNIRFLRQRYNDPMTGKPDWRMIKVGENKTSVKGFFGQPLAGVGGGGLGSAAGLASSSGTSAFGQAPGAGGSASNAAGLGSPSTPGAAAAGTGLGSTTPGSSQFGLSSTSPIGSQSASGFSGTGAPFLGVGLPTPGTSILTVNEQTAYPDWEFLYDPRIEQLKARVNLFGGGAASTSASSLGSASGLSTPTGGPGSPSPTSTPPSTTSSPFSGSAPQ